MSNYTPGPWRVDRGSMLDGVNVITPRHEWVCYLGMASRPDAVADAQLIAAAPDLLEALDRVVEMVRDPDIDAGDSLERIAAIAAAALTKARGQS